MMINLKFANYRKLNVDWCVYCLYLSNREPKSFFFKDFMFLIYLENFFLVHVNLSKKIEVVQQQLPWRSYLLLFIMIIFLRFILKKSFKTLRWLFLSLSSLLFCYFINKDVILIKKKKTLFF